MKKLILTIALIISVCSLQAEQYHKLLNKTNKWNYLYESLTTCYCGELRTYSYTISNDTIIESQTYTKIMCKVSLVENYQNEIRETNTYAAALREDSLQQKVYVIYPGQVTETLLYNFNLHVGDTIEVKDVYSDQWTDSKTIRKVKSVEQYSFGNVTGKVVTVCDSTFTNYRGLHWPYSWSTNIESNTDSWYEGIGSIKSLVHSETMYNSTKLLCFWNNNDQIYHEPSHPNCVYALWMATDNVSENPTVVVSKITKDKLTINPDLKIKSVQIYNSNGIKMVETSAREINITVFPMGLYFVRIQTESGETKVSKIIK